MREPEVKRAKSGVRKVLLGIVFLALLLLGWQTLSRQQYLPVDVNDKTRLELKIPEGSSAGEVARLLKKKDLIRSENAFLAYCRREKMDARLKAGTFSLSRSMSLQQISIQLVEGKGLQNAITIPEGYTLQEIGKVVEAHKKISPTAWQAALQDDYNYDFLPPKSQPNRLEGYLYPDTYVLAEQADAHDIIEQMLANFSQHWNKDFAKLARTNQNTHDVIIIASLIEREAQRSEERKRIAGVIYNRLSIDMPLQIDATVLYSLGIHKDKVSYQDLQVDSLYNTYRYKGLPVGPIACPGSASIYAALQPENNDYYYYVSKGDGSHQFSKTFAEHQAAIKKNSP